MGIFSKFFNKSDSGDRRSDFEPIDIVGESFYKASFKTLRSQFGAKVGDRVSVRVELKAESDNPYGIKGKAVAALIGGLKVGHVSNSQVLEAHAAITAVGGSLIVSGSVYFADNRESVAMNSVSANYKVKKYVPPPPSEKEVEKQQQLAEKVKIQVAKLKKQGWSSKQIQAGDKVCFTQFPDNGVALGAKAEAAGIEVIGNVVKTLDLLVIHTESRADDSAKGRKAIDYGIPIATLDSYLRANPNLSGD